MRFRRSWDTANRKLGTKETEEEAMSEAAEARSDYYLELAVMLRALALEARYPSARRALMEMAQRFDRRADRPVTEIAIPG